MDESGRWGAKMRFRPWTGVNSASNGTLGGVWEVGLLVFLWRQPNKLLKVFHGHCLNFRTSWVKTVGSETSWVWQGLNAVHSMALGTVNTSVPTQLLSYRANLTADTDSDVLSPSAMPDSDIIRLKARWKVNQKVLGEILAHKEHRT